MEGIPAMNGDYDDIDDEGIEIRFEKEVEDGEPVEVAP